MNPRPLEPCTSIGVNRAIEAAPCEWFAFNDHESFLWRRPHLPPGQHCFTSTQALRLIRKQLAGEIVDSYQWLTYPQIGTRCPSNAHWTNFSMLVGMVLAEYLLREEGAQGPRGPGAQGRNASAPSDPRPLEPLTPKTIRLYGVDWNGEEDWDGPSPTRVIRTAYRWNNEQYWYQRVCKWLAEQDIEVVRVQPEAALECTVAS